VPATHHAHAAARRTRLAEVWDTREQHDAWFEANVKPNVPGEIKQEVIDLHSIHTP